MTELVKQNGSKVQVEINELNRKLDFIIEELAIQKQKRQALEDLMKLNLIGTVRTDYVRRILDVFSSSDSHLDISPASVSSAKSRQAGLIDPLTERELDVLRLIARGLKYKEIADNLFISQNTVRFHVKAIYGKLNVNNRTQAIEKARQLQIL